MKSDPSLTLVSASPLNSQEAEMNALLKEVSVPPYVTHVPETVCDSRHITPTHAVCDSRRLRLTP